MSWNILATTVKIAGIGAESANFMRENGCFVTVAEPFRAQSATDLQPLLAGIHAVYAGPHEFSAELLATPEAAELRIISRWGVGFDQIDVHGKTLGIIGCGRIGTAVARRATGFDLRVLACDPFPNDAARKLGVEFVQLDSLLAQSDFVSLHAPVTPETKGLISEAQLKLMKPDAYLINTARGALVDESALVRALNDGGLAGAAVDAFVEEPLPAKHPFRMAKNLLLAPHQAAFSNETGRRVSATCAEAIVDLMHGKRPKMVLNPEVFDSPKLRAKLQK